MRTSQRTYIAATPPFACGMWHNNLEKDIETAFDIEMYAHGYHPFMDAADPFMVGFQMNYLDWPV